MSKFKTPREKKLASLALDGRNVYGENDKASRKLIPRRKQESHQGQRRATRIPMLRLAPGLEEDDLVRIETEVKEQEIRGKRNAFKKKPDASLQSLLEYKKTGNWQELTRKRS